MSLMSLYEFNEFISTQYKPVIRETKRARPKTLKKNKKTKIGISFYQSLGMTVRGRLQFSLLILSEFKRINQLLLTLKLSENLDLKKKKKFFVWVFFHEHSRITGLQGKGESISLTSPYHFHPLQRQLDICRTITVESSTLLVASNRTRTRNLWLPSASR